jgi:hypothetical protein
MDSKKKQEKRNIMKTRQTKLMSLAMLVGSALGFGGGDAFAQDDFRQEYHHHKNAYYGYQEGYHFAFRHGFDDGFNGRAYENRANTRDEYAAYDEGYQRGKAKFAFRQAHLQW